MEPWWSSLEWENLPLSPWRLIILLSSLLLMVGEEEKEARRKKVKENQGGVLKGRHHLVVRHKMHLESKAFDIVY